MGIKGLNSFLKQYGKKVELSNYQNQKVAIDTSIYLYKYKYKATQKQFLQRFQYQINQFERNNIMPLYIFDGKAPIEKLQVKEKRREVQEKNEDAIIITKEDIIKLKDKFDENEIYYYVAPEEGEKFCSYLNKTGKIDIVMSNDLDSLLFGTTILLTQSKDGYIEYKLQEILDKLNINLQELIELGIASGCDYNPIGVAGMGPSKSLKRLKKEGSIKVWKDCPENIDRLIELFTNFHKEEQICKEIEFDQTESNEDGSNDDGSISSLISETESNK